MEAQTLIVGGTERRVLIVRFARAKMAFAAAAAITVVIFGLPWLAITDVIPGLTLPPDVYWPTVLLFVLLFGWAVVGPPLIPAVRGAFVALTEAGVLIHSGLSSVLIPWTAIETASTDIDPRNASYRYLHLSLRIDHKVPGWPWPAILALIFLPSSRRNLRIHSWWFPGVIDRTVHVIGYLVSHPEERARIEDADSEKWSQAIPDAGG